MKIFFFTPVIVVLLAVCACSNTKKESSEYTEQDKRPNIILLMGDDHGWDEVGYNGHPFVKTPVLDEMAASGLRFDRFYSAHPSCSPTRGSFMTGRHPNRYGTFSPNWSIRPEEISIAQLLSDAGYACAHYGKWHLGPVKKDSPTSPGAMGFDEWLSHDNFFEIDPVLSRNGGTPERIEGESSAIIVEETIRFIKKTRQNKQPFFVVVWFGSPHEPYSGLPEDIALYENLPDSLNRLTVQLTSNKTGERVDRSLRDVLKERYAEITAMDRSIGTLREFLKENKLKDNTLVWYCGDNGTPPSAGRTGMTVRAQKGSLYEGGVLVPGVLEWPQGVKKHGVVESSAITSDFLPTLAELTGQSLPDRPLDGISLVSFFNEPEKLRGEPIFFWQFESGKVFDDEAEPYIDPELQEGTTPLVKMMNGKYTRTFRNLKYDVISEADYGGERTVVNDRFKLVVDGVSPGDAGFELYDLQNDRGETINLASEFPEIVEQMQKELRNWQESVLKSLTGADYK
ncbi:sulfatase-like hydrolase/transferase [Maribellus comscasis]|uniref:Sulfatase-like hydrolase/transferase n=1 Tax=Maribellus comscasis TaxID=2681766 RepID=A0A6I6JPK1_9BACT|nr:sulfatase-like hydrolase/transferase [Maribellus comscasis]QGY42978.1 sulfatase-like hydrolase/transferase [Maribellus comscasis]